MKDSHTDRHVLIHPDGSTVTLVERGVGELGEYLRVEHKINRKGAINGPHWHPIISEMFTVKQGKMRFRVDGEETLMGPGRTISISPGQVHQFWNEGGDPLVALHEIRPPGLHWQMFALLHKLETEGRMNRKGIPRNPLWLGYAWETMEGYLAGPPKIIQKIVLGGLARLARAVGYKV